MHFQRSLFAAATAGFLFAAAGASAEAPEQVGTFKNWGAFVSGAGDARVCYAMSKPTMSEPAKIKRDPIFFLINDWPGRKAKSEPEIVPGYEYKDGSTVTVEIGADKFEFFTKNEGKAGGAWVEKQEDETRLVQAMRRGAEVIVIGTSKRGTVTHDTYSLGGLSEALDKAHESCGL